MRTSTYVKSMISPAANRVNIWENTVMSCKTDAKATPLTKPELDKSCWLCMVDYLPVIMASWENPELNGRLNGCKLEIFIYIYIYLSICVCVEVLNGIIIYKWDILIRHLWYQTVLYGFVISWLQGAHPFLLMAIRRQKPWLSTGIVHVVRGPRRFNMLQNGFTVGENIINHPQNHHKYMI